MGISIEHYRHVVGNYNRCKNAHQLSGGYGKFLYCADMADSIKQLFQTMLLLDRTELYIPVLFFVIIIMGILMMLSLSLVIDLSNRSSNVKSSPATSDMPYNLVLDQGVMFTCIRLYLVVILFQSKFNALWESTIAANLFIKFKSKLCKKFRTRSHRYQIILLYYTTLINILLLITTIPNIVNPGPDLNISYCNVQGLILSTSMKSSSPIFQTNKLLDLQSYMHYASPDVLILNETWLNEHVHSNEIVSDLYYKCFRLDRSEIDKSKYNKVGGGGVMILVKQNLNVQSRLININCNIPVLSIEITLENHSKFCLSTFIDIITLILTHLKRQKSTFKLFLQNIAKY